MMQKYVDRAGTEEGKEKEQENGRKERMRKMEEWTRRERKIK